MLKPGSVVYTETPSYLRSLQVFPSAGMKLSGIPMDREGILFWNIADQTENALLYTIPTFHNPTGTVTSEARRQELFRFCSNNGSPSSKTTPMASCGWRNPSETAQNHGPPR
jgi:GntR family transcriptional regulator of abcA and norABC